VSRPTEATPLAGGENDGDGGLAHVWSLPCGEAAVADATPHLSIE
jgi:hypothetical protein